MILEQQANLWSFGHVADATCITTNGYVRRDGAAVMGRGCALEAARFWPGLPQELGRLIQQNGNVVQEVPVQPGPRARVLVALPVKPANFLLRTTHDETRVVRHMQEQFRVGALVPGWAVKADLQVIRSSLYQLRQLAAVRGWRRVVLPRPGCGAGELAWQHEVRPVVQEVLALANIEFLVVHR